MKRYNNMELDEIYSSIMLDSLHITNPELLKYKKIFDHIFWHYVMMFDQIGSDQNAYKKSYLYLKKLINILIRIPDEKLCDVDEDLLNSIDFGPLPSKSDLYLLECLVLPEDIEKRNTEEYISQIIDYIDKLFQDTCAPESNINNITLLLSSLYDSVSCDMWNDDGTLICLLFAYLYAHQEEYDINNVNDIFTNYLNNISYYREVFTLETGIKDANETPYDALKKVLQFYSHLGKLIEKHKAKKLIK